MTTLYVRVASLLLFALPASPVLAQDDRKDLSVSVFTGFSIDSFAAKDLHDYLNPDASGDVQEQLVAGFNFQYRLTGTTDNRPKLWLYGESVHGVRSGDVDCAVDANSEICQNLDFQTPATGSGLSSLAIFRKSTSFEGLTGLRYEFARLGSDENPSQLYIKAQLGFLTVAGAGGDVRDIHHAALGLVLTRGVLKHSYFEIGRGVNDVFADGKARYKLDALLSFNKVDDNRESNAISPFAQIVIDFDGGDGADSIQSYFGFDLDIAAVF